MDNLENKILKQNGNEPIKPDGKQWLPLGIGVYFAVKDALQGKPHIMDPSNRVRLYASAFYHGMISAYPIYLGIKRSCSKLN